ncbi:MAG TPA: hypothetical protein VGM82_23645 [Gemmatimonadaceae bacterium]|jgi:hypothetical protein
MAQQRIIWTVLPNGRGPDGRLRVSITVSPRLTPQTSSEQVLKAFTEWRDWPSTLAQAKFRLRVGAQAIDLTPSSKPDSRVWSRLFHDDTPVAGFVFKNMAQVNLRSYSVRSVLALVRQYYGNLAVQSSSTHPTLLPWKDAHPGLKGMLTDLGTRTQSINFGSTSIQVPVPGFNRFFDDDNKQGVEAQLGTLVFGPKSRNRGTSTGTAIDGQGNPTQGAAFPLRVLPTEWVDPVNAGTNAPIMSQFTTSAEYTLYQADRFYRRVPLTQEKIDKLKASEQLRRPKLVDVPPTPAAPDFDFHRIVASFSDYSGLLRALGLVIDFTLPAGSAIDQLIAAAGAADATGVMNVEIAWSNAHKKADDSCPQSAWVGSAARFVMRARSSDHQNGLLHLVNANDKWGAGKDSPFDVYQVDPDGAALKTVNFLLTAQNLVSKSLSTGAAGEVTYTTGDKQPVAALRSTGLGISRHGRAVIVAQNAASAALKNAAIQSGSAASAKVVLFAEDVLRGYRVDVQPITPAGLGDWRSLMKRHGTYRFIGGSATDTIDFPDDEGYVKGASTTSSPNEDADPDDHYLHESLFRWTGWSLAAPRPGRTLRAQVDETSGVQGEVPTDVTDEATTGGNGLAVSYVAQPRTLPKLRFGLAYRFRARMVDLAGNSLDLEDGSLPNDVNASFPVIYWRFEPVDPPALVHRTRTSEGESLERMVVRSNWNADTTSYPSTPAFAAAIALPASADFEYIRTNERHFVPPKASQLQCEHHGAFDALMDNPGEIKTAYAVAAREAGTLYDSGPSTQIELVTPASLTGVATTTALPPQLPSHENPTGDRMAPGQYVIHREAQVATPYLPDPAAGGVAIRAMPGDVLPGVTGPMVLGPGAVIVMTPNQELVVLVAHAKSWPDNLGFRIVLAERKETFVDAGCVETFADTGVPTWDESNRVLTFYVPKGRIVRLRYSSFVDKRFINTIGIADWTASAGERQFVSAMALAGCGWMTNPYRPLTLVHATQQPVCPPEFLTLNIQRNIGDQHAVLQSRVRMHGPSTGKFEVEAVWKEWVDDLDKPGPELITSHGQLGEILLSENHENLFDLASAIDAQQPAPPPQQLANTQPRARGDRHEFGDTKFRLIQYTMRATTRFREYLPQALYDQRDQITRVGPIGAGPTMQVGAADDPGAPVLQTSPLGATDSVIPASAPPDEPRIVYTVPTFKWSESVATGSKDTTRLGNGVRVYLERPWFSSGNGELLGVVILGENTNFTDIPAPLVPLVTQWGLDPLWDTTLPKYRTRVEDFPTRVTSEPVSLREVPTQSVQIVGHRVHWDADRSLWYCDIELDPGTSYMPFVRLALVRYQPNALPDAKISKVALAEFAQVLPRRRATFARTGSQIAFTFRGTVPDHGPMLMTLDSEYQDVSFVPPPGSLGETGRNKVELVLQTRDPNINSDLAWSDFSLLTSSVVAPPGAATNSPIGPVVSPVLNPVLNAATVKAQPATKAAVTIAATAKAATVAKVTTIASTAKVVTPVATTKTTTPASTTEQRVGLGTGVTLGPITAGGLTTVGQIDVGGIIQLLDPAIWQATVTLPDVGGKPARLVVREYERYFTDYTIPEVRGGGTHRRRVVEERLVYTAMFDL